MTDKVKVLLPDGVYISLFQWQELYGLKKYSKQISKYFSLNEDRFQQDIALFGELIVCADLMRIVDRYRELVGEPTTFNSFNRNADYQKKLTEQGYRTASFSPHEVKLAGDIDTPGQKELAKKFPGENPEKIWAMACELNRSRTKLMCRAADELGIKARIGNEQYLREKQTFIHVDVCPEYYAPGKPWHKLLHPRQWESPISW
jgi:hypothetical protein